jgi:hypothetical protein
MNGTAKHSIFLFQTDHITQLDLDRVERGFQDAEYDYKRLDRLIRVVEAIVVW